MLQWGPSLNILQEVQKATGQTPPALAARPLLRPECYQDFKAFKVLSASRDSNGFGGNPIRVSEVSSYAMLMGMGREEATRLLRIIQALDVAYLGYHAEKNKTS